MQRRTIVAILLIALPALALAATGTVTLTRLGSRGAERVEIEWTTDQASGTVRETLGLDGYLERVVFVPDNDGASTPTANYDVKLMDASSFDLLTSAGLNRSQTATEEAIFFPGTGTTATTGTQRYNIGPVELQIDNASTSPSTGSGIIRMYLRR